MGNNIKVETWLGNEIRFVEVNNEWWAVAGDVAKALDIGNVSMFVRGLDDDECDISIIEVTSTNKKSRKTQKVNIISELGIYEAIFKSRKPEAKEFKKWVKQVIKSLRETVGLEQYEVFRMMDKEKRKLATDVLKNGIDNAEPKHYAKAHTIANKAVSNMYGFDKLVQVKDMTPDMLRDRQNIYEAVIEVMIANDRYNLGLSVSKTIYEKFGV